MLKNKDLILKELKSYGRVYNHMSVVVRSAWLNSPL